MRLQLWWAPGTPRLSPRQWRARLRAPLIACQLRASNPGQRIWAVFEPRSASSCRRVFQDDFARAFAAADRVLIAPVFRSTLPEDQRLSTSQLVADLRQSGVTAGEGTSIDDLIATIVREHRAGDLVVLMSNGGFGGIHEKLLVRLSA